MNRIILASGSPRRRELLEQMGIKFRVVTAEVEEEPPADWARLVFGGEYVTDDTSPIGLSPSSSNCKQFWLSSLCRKRMVLDSNSQRCCVYVTRHGSCDSGRSDPYCRQLVSPGRRSWRPELARFSTACRHWC